MEDNKISIKDLEDFIGCKFWGFFKRELDEMRANVMANLLITKEHDEMCRCQARVEVLGDIIELPEVTLQGLKEKKDER